MTYTAHLDRRRFGLYVVELAALALACVIAAIVVGGVVAVIAGIAALAYGAGATYTAAYLRRNPPVIAADARGVRLKGAAAIPWSDIERVSLSDGAPGKRSVVFFVRDSARYMAGLSGMRARQAQRRFRRVGSPFAVAEREFVEPPEGVIDAVQVIRTT